MTDEEIADIILAEAWAGENGFNSDCNNINSVEANRELVNAFLAGLKAKAQWHDLRKNPDDLPKENTTVLLLTEVEPVTARYDKKYELFFRMNEKLNYCIFIAPMSYIAWCEIPTFEE